MTKKKIRPVTRSINNQTLQSQTSPGVTVNPVKLVSQSYNAEKYIKQDVMWTIITAGIVVVVMVILYYILR
jgi:hypothetical protein